ncbi:MAG: peptidase inhibitor family I36 protein [Actinocatenispora sp.]
MAKKFRIGLLVLASAVGLAIASPAQAASGYDRCPDNYYCMFSGLDGSGDMVTFQSSNPDLRTVNMDKRARSDWNRTGSSVWLNSDYNYAGCDALTSAGSQGNLFSSFQNYFSSVRVGGSGGQSCQTVR